MAFGSAIPDKVNSFGVANTPVARITSASPFFGILKLQFWKLQLAKCPFFQTALWVATQIKNETNIQLFIVSRPGKPDFLFHSES